MGKDGQYEQAHGQKPIAGAVAGQPAVVEIDDEEGEELEQPVHPNPPTPDDASRVHGHGRSRDEAYLV